MFKYLNKISEELDFKLVMVTNQDGLGTGSFPEETFWPVQNFIINSFKNEEVSFFLKHILIRVLRMRTLIIENQELEC